MLKIPILAQSNANLCIRNKESCTIWGSDFTLAGSDSERTSNTTGHSAEHSLMVGALATAVSAGRGRKIVARSSMGLSLYTQRKISLLLLCLAGMQGLPT